MPPYPISLSIANHSATVKMMSTSQEHSLDAVLKQLSSVELRDDNTLHGHVDADTGGSLLNLALASTSQKVSAAGVKFITQASPTGQDKLSVADADLAQLSEDESVLSRKVPP